MEIIFSLIKITSKIKYNQEIKSNILKKNIFFELCINISYEKFYQIHFFKFYF